MKRRNETKVDIDVFSFLENKRDFNNKWEVRKTLNKNIQSILDKSSKSGSGKNGYPDLIYINDEKKILILVENKASTLFHQSEERKKISDYAVDGIIHYLSFFQNSFLTQQKTSIKNYLNGWHIIGIAFSGDINDDYNHLLSTFIIKEDNIIEQEIKEFLNEEEYLSLFENFDLEIISNNISKSSREINRLLRNVDSQKRPILLSALMICLYEKIDIPNDFKNSYQTWQVSTIVSNIPTTIGKILFKENISQDKINVLINELAFIKTDSDLNDTRILVEILNELENNVIPLFNKKSSYDIIGKFYEEFLRFAGVSNVKKGIVLTPNHVTNLFTKLIDIKSNDIIFDPCCGTGAFLIAGMNKLISIINNSEIANKTERINLIKENQLVGFEKSNTMYTLAISNMLFRGDGKSKIYNIDFFKDEALDVLNEIKPTIGFMNPPFGGSDNTKNPTKREIQFLERMLDSVSRYGIIIAPISTFFKDNTTRNRILSKHTLRYVINMPSDLFQPNASTITSIAVFETNLPHNSKEVIFYDLKDDGLVLSKHKGRIDRYNKWGNIEKDLLSKLKNSDDSNPFKLVSCKINKDDEWLFQAHSETNYSLLDKKQFITSIKRHIIFNLKSKLDLINKDIDEITLMEMIYENVDNSACDNVNIELNTSLWKDFRYGGDKGIFEIFGGYYNKKPEHIVDGDIPFIGASKENNGITEYYSITDIENSQKDTDSKIHDLNQKLFKGNCITVANNGSAGSAFYQDKEFTCSHDVNILYLKRKELNVYIALFLRTIIEMEKFRWDFGRKWRPIRMPNSIIKLPVDKKGNPDWDYMENFIKSLPYSKSL